MKYYKVVYISFLLIVLAILTKLFIIKPKTTLIVYKNKINISSTTISIPIEILSNKDAIYKLDFYLKENKKFDQKLSENIILALKKEQSYNFDYSFQIDNQKRFFSINAILTELLPGKLSYKQTIYIKKPISLQEIPKVEISTFTPMIAIKEQQKLKEEQKTEKEKPSLEVKEKPNFEITIVQDFVKKEYLYDEKIKFNVLLKNKTSTLTITPKLIALFKDENDIIISSKTLNIKLEPLKEKQEELEFEIAKNISPGDYLVEIIAKYENIEKSLQTDEFLVIDIPPKITIPEIPNIKYKLTNTIVVEVEDDREIQEVYFVEINKNKEIKNRMILVAGNKKAGLYSFTTPKITNKNFYSFYIQAKDIAGNISKTETYQVKISK